MIVFEGPDGAGKTTLIKQFSEMYDIPVAPRVVSKDTEALVNLQDWVDNSLEEGFQRTIFDRYRLISEPIYGPILRDKMQPGFADINWLGERIQAFYELEPIIIYCLPSLETVRRNVLGDDDNQAVAATIDKIYAAYVNRASIDYALSPGTVKIWNYEAPNASLKPYPIWFPAVARHINSRIKK